MPAKRETPACQDFMRTLKVSRRSVLEAGWLGSMGLGLSGLWASQAKAALLGTPAQEAMAAPPRSAGFGAAKKCILIFMWGGPSQLDTWDLKPDAPAEVRGEFKPIETSVPGILISEHFPRLAKWAHRYAIIRSLTHDDPAHLSSAHHILTGHYAPRRFSDADPPSHNDWPTLGSVIAKLRPGGGAVPAFVTMPWTVAHPAAPGGRAPGQNGGWLGSRLDPMTIGDPNDPGFKIEGFELPGDVASRRLGGRKQLLDRLDAETGDSDWRALSASEWSGLSGKAFDLLSGTSAQRAFSLAREAPALRELYGRNTHGQCLLLARRLIEAGVSLVTVNWQNDGQNFWDTHGDNFRHLRDRLMPPADQGFAALLTDLEARGLLDETLVVWVGEFGRRPHITRENAGREHWPRCFSAVVAGGGVRGGTVYGSSDRIAAFPNENPATPSDLSATIMHALGVDPETLILDRQGVTRNLYAGRPIDALF